MKNSVKFFAVLVSCIFLIPILSTIIVIPITDSSEPNTALLQSLRGDGVVSNPISRTEGTIIEKLPGMDSSSESNNLNQIGQINSKVEGTGVFIEDYVDNDVSNVDSTPDVGDVIDFNYMKATDNSFANLSEAISSGIITKAGTDTSTSGIAYPLSWAHTLVAGTNRMVVVYTGYENNAILDISSMTYGGQAMTQ
ncbi:MAG: hypothetical protein ACW98I_13830, partial [Candidatus Hodarchaeales archaeon]